MPSTLTNAVARAAYRLQRVQLWLAAAALLIMVGVIVADVLLRYFLNWPIRGSYELVEAMLVVFVFHGIAAAFFERANIVIDLIDQFIGPRAVRYLIRLSDALSLVGLVILTYAMIGPLLLAYEYGDRKLELQLPVYLLWIVAVAGMIGTLFCVAARTTRPSEPEGPS